MTQVTRLSDDLVELRFPNQAAAESAAACLRQQRGLLEVVTGIDTLTVQFDCTEVNADDVLERVAAAADAPPAGAKVPDVFEVPVCYASDMAPDLDAVCERLGLDRDAFIRLHTAGPHRVRLIGFAPGFAYVDGLDARLDVPRHARPRQHVPAGSIAIAGRQTGIYSMRSPGGWQIIGRTPIALFDPSQTPPMRLAAGQAVRFYPISAEQFESLAAR